jgi:hypothetical protein
VAKVATARRLAALMVMIPVASLLIAILAATAAAPPPPAAVDPEAAGDQRRLFVMGYLGWQRVFLHDTSESGEFGAGYRLGAMAGARVNRRFSLNGGIALDRGSYSSDTPNGAYHGVLSESQLVFTPLLHLHPGPVQVIAGPRLGLLLGRELWGNDGLGSNVQSGVHFGWWGWAFGLELGVAFPVARPVSLGALVTMDVMAPLTRSCDECGAAQDVASYPPRHTVVSGGLALLY